MSRSDSERYLEETRQLQEKLNGRFVRLDAGEYSIAETLLDPHGAGLSFCGACSGLGHRVSAGTGQSSIVWRGARDSQGPMLQLTGSHYEVGHLAFSGRFNRRSTECEHLVGVAIRRGPVGIGSGKHIFGPLAFSGMGVGVMIGKEADDHNCDCCCYTNLKLRTVHTGVQFNCDMAMSHRFEYIHAVDVGTLFEINRGGILYAAHIDAMGPMTLLRFKQPGPGPNNGKFRLSNIKVDKGAGSKLVVVESEGPHEAHITIEDLTFSVGQDYPADNAYAFAFEGPEKVTIRDATHLQRGMIKVTGDDANVLVERSVLAVDDAMDLLHPDSSGSFRFKTRDNFDRRGRPVREAH